uniref:Uncharacterized protein n=1 Tax=Arundo donax TaxID=35708 RepID=A0A0A9BFV5_ARUDO
MQKIQVIFRQISWERAIKKWNRVVELEKEGAVCNCQLLMNLLAYQ